MDNLQTAKMELVFEDGAELETWQPADLISLCAFRYKNSDFSQGGDGEKWRCISRFFARSEEIGWEEKSIMKKAQCFIIVLFIPISGLAVVSVELNRNRAAGSCLFHYYGSFRACFQNLC